MAGFSPLGGIGPSRLGRICRA